MISRRSTRQTFMVSLIAALLLTSCNVGATPAPTQDINAMSTALVGTTVAQLSIQFTQTALALPTNTAAPTETQTPPPTFAVLPTDASAVASATLGSGVPTSSTPPTVSFANTPVAGFTQIVLPGASTNTPIPCDNSIFEGDITYPDGSVLKPGEDFQKIWAIRNTGVCKWDDGYSLVYIAGSKPDLDPYNFEFKKSSDFVAAGQGINIAINLTAPCTPGKYEGHWRMKNDQGFYFGTILSVYIEVKDKC